MTSVLEEISYKDMVSQEVLITLELKDQDQPQSQKKSSFKKGGELKNIGIDSLEVNPHTRDQSNRVSTNNMITLVCSIFTNILLLFSLQIIHITHCGTKFQIFNECFPN